MQIKEAMHVKGRRMLPALLFVVFSVLMSASAVLAAPGDVFLAKMKVTREVVLGTIIEYEVQDAIRGPAILKTPPYQLRVGEALNMFVKEGVPENGRPAYMGLSNVSARSFKNGLAPVCINNYWNFMDKNGKLLSKYVFEKVGDFSEGLAPCFVESAGWVFIDTKGEILKTPLIFAAVDNSDIWSQKILSGFAEGYALMGSETKDRSSTVILIDKNGKMKAQCTGAIGAGGKFSGGLAPIRTDINRWGYVDTRGDLAIDPNFYRARSFQEGLAAVTAGESLVSEKWGFIDKQGDFVVKPIYSFVGDFSEGLAKVRTGNLYGFIDKSGNIVANTAFEEARSFLEGFAAVKRGGAWGYINKKGEVAVNYTFDDAKDFSGGLAPVRVKGAGYSTDWGYIDKTGKLVLQPKYERAEPFSDGLALVVEKFPKEQRGRARYNKIKYINPAGQAALWFLAP